ncbi:MAG TPA: metallophosphoesterase [Bryobacteraceae bacterium]|jgi:hypothetical protein|nr:metallophosphoesterase [Bryobacteraceae bacterium]
MLLPVRDSRLTRRYAVWLLFFACFPLLAQSDIGAVVPEDKPIRAAALGDFGTGGKDEIDVVRAIAREDHDKPFQLGLTLGDNFYRCGVRGVDDPIWKRVWSSFFDPLGIPFYATLGNHDYGRGAGPVCLGAHTDPAAEVAFTQRSATWRMPARYYRFSAGPVEFLALDTEEWGEDERQWVQQRLAVRPPGIHWVVVYGHHPIFSSGRHGGTAKLRSQLLPLLKRAKVDAYISGHDHDMEHLRADGIDFFVAGGGGASTYSVSRRDPHSLFAFRQHGFLVLEADSQALRVRLLDTHGKVLGTPFVKTT